MADRIDMYLKWNNQDEYYVNTQRENELVNKFQALYSITKSAQDTCEECNQKNLDKWRRAYLGTLGALRKDTGDESSVKGRQLRKMIYEIIESLVDNSVPMPKMKPRYKSDLPLVNITENYLKFEVDDILTKFENDRSERATYIDGTGWYKVWWDSLSNTHERSGDVRIEFCPVDQVYPQPGVKDYKKLEYIFELRQVSTTRIYDLYGRNIIPNQGDTNLVDVVSCYYLNEDRIVGLFMWSPTSLQVICNEKDWQIRKVRKCKTCGEIVPSGDVCPRCGGKSFKYHNAETEILEEDLMEVYNPYEVGETNDPSQQDELAQKVFLKAGTEVPFYRIGQLPFVPRPAVSHVNSIYGISISGMLLDMQDMINKIYTKMADKTLKSGAVVTQFEKGRPIDDTNETFKILKVKTPEEAAMVTVKQVVADTSQDMVVASTIYESGKASSGVTASFQGQKDSSAASGKAKEYQALQTAGRIESLRVMKAAAFAGVYELVLKYLLAFSDESRKFVKILPNGEQLEQSWNKYMFLAKDKYGQIYYRDDIKFDTDPASTITQSRSQMWQEMLNMFTMGAFGDSTDPRNRELFWNIMDQLGYPEAKTILAGIKDNSQHLPPEIEQALMQNPEALQTAIAMIQQGQDGRGGARENSGPQGNGMTHAANVEKTNSNNRAKSGGEAFTPQSNEATTIGSQIR